MYIRMEIPANKNYMKIIQNQKNNFRILMQQLANWK